MDSKTFYENNSSREIVDEESSGSDYTPTDSEERIADESSDHDDSDADESDADDIEILSGAYTWNFQVYTGKTNNVYGLNTTESLTVSLTKSALNLGSTIYSDNYYTSLVLAEYLLQKKTYFYGTICKNRKHLSKDMVEAKLKRMK